MRTLQIIAVGVALSGCGGSVEPEAVSDAAADAPTEASTDAIGCVWAKAPRWCAGTPGYRCEIGHAPSDPKCNAVEAGTATFCCV